MDRVTTCTTEWQEFLSSTWGCMGLFGAYSAVGVPLESYLVWVCCCTIRWVEFSSSTFYN
jgi:hypothetical protein